MGYMFLVQAHKPPLVTILQMAQPHDYAALRAIIGGGEYDGDAEAVLSKLRPLLLADARSDDLICSMAGLLRDQYPHLSPSLPC